MRKENKMIRAMIRKVGGLVDGALPSYTFPGGYPIFYMDAESSAILCPKCATKSLRDSDPLRRPVEADVNYEDARLMCGDCNKRIPSAYAEGALDYNWLRYGALEIFDAEGREVAFLQGDEAAELYDQLEAADEEAQQRILEQYDTGRA